ncbi:MAG TPA: FtsQ-type POTRA domain-containing protein [Stellaceae bacterium]|nr:FtsQ-type POTRA domain-containing protein [Stellaceae bacterium]
MRFLNRLLTQGRAVLRRALFAAAGLAFCALLGAGFWLWHAGVLAPLTARLEARLHGLGAENGLALDKVEIEGRDRQSKESILAALAVQQGMPVLDIDLAAAQARLEGLPWVRSAEIERRMPDTLHIKIEERRPYAFWQKNGQLMLIDRDGMVIPAGDLSSYGPLIVLVGDDAPGNAVPLFDMLKTEPALAARVRAGMRLGQRRWTLRFDNGVEAALPETDAPAAWHRLAALEASGRVLERAIIAIDLRLPDRVVLKALPAPSTKSAPKDKST